jgi:hypothetical protein
MPRRPGQQAELEDTIGLINAWRFSELQFAEVGMAAWALVAATFFAVAVGAWLTSAFRDQQKAKIHEKRLDAYSGLWELTKDFRKNGPPVDTDGCHQLARELTDWYYRPQGGMLITNSTRKMFLTIRTNLEDAPGPLRPESWQRDLIKKPKQDTHSFVDPRTLLLWRQFSLLRTQLKNDCSIYYGREVSGDVIFRPYDIDFLDEGTNDLSKRDGRDKLSKKGVWKKLTRKARREERNKLSKNGVWKRQTRKAKTVSADEYLSSIR